MGKIEDSILQNYKKSLLHGNVSQAKKSVELVKTLRYMIENQGFEDYEHISKKSLQIIGTLLEPVPYKYYPDQGVVVLFKATISLTETENKLFYLLTQNESHQEDIKIIRKNDIKNFVWPNKDVTNNSVRISIKRLRDKIEPNPETPQILLNFNRKGYVFVAKQIA